MRADDYGNAAAYFSGNSNLSTSRYLGISQLPSSNLGRSRVAAYTHTREENNNGSLSTAARYAATSSMIVGWCGLRPVAFPLESNWNGDVPTD